MDNIFSIITKSAPYVVFIVLQIIAGRSLYNNNNYHKAKIVNYSNIFNSKIYERVNNVKTFLSYKETNLGLKKENSELKKQIFKLSNIINEQELKNKISESESKLSYLNNFSIKDAKIIHNTLYHRKNYMIIDKGKNDGIKNGMGVITDKGPVGIIIEVSDNYSSVMSILNSNSSISSKTEKSQIASNLEWSGNNCKIMNLKEVPKHLKIIKGERLLTSGYSSYFPAGLPIGKIVNIDPKKSHNFAYIEVKLDNDFSKLNYVFVIQHKHQNELKNIESKIEELKNQDSNE